MWFYFEDEQKKTRGDRETTRERTSLSHEAWIVFHSQKKTKRGKESCPTGAKQIGDENANCLHIARDIESTQATDRDHLSEWMRLVWIRLGWMMMVLMWMLMIFSVLFGIEFFAFFRLLFRLVAMILKPNFDLQRTRRRITAEACFSSYLGWR